jgi:hypothetical protein
VCINTPPDIALMSLYRYSGSAVIPGLVPPPPCPPAR